MKVISLCDGISVAQASLIEVGYEITSYHASEIEKNAIAVTQRNYPNTIQIGDITQVDGRSFGYQDFLFSGTPCQGFSFAGKQLAFDDPRSALFWHFVRIKRELEEANPNIWFLFENVIMKEEHSKVISKALGVSPIRINSNLVSAQNRDRFYWTNIPYFWPPEDRGIMLKDIIHENTDGMDIEKYKVPITRALKLLDSEVAKRKVALIGDLDNQSNRVYSIHGKAITLSGAGGGGAVNMGQYLIPQSNRLTDIDGKCSTLNVGNTGGANMPHIKVPEARTIATARGEDKGGIAPTGKARTIGGNDYASIASVACFGVVRPDKEKTYQRARINEGDKAYTLVHGANNGVLVGSEPKDVLGCLSPDRVEKRQNGQNGQRFSEGEKFYTLTAQDQHGILTDGYIRKLTPIECERLQCLPDGFTEGISATQRYRALGNSWTRDVIVYILSGLEDWKREKEYEAQMNEEIAGQSETA